jgi:hypothetical protein
MMGCAKIDVRFCRIDVAQQTLSLQKPKSSTRRNRRRRRRRRRRCRRDDGRRAMMRW